MTTQSPQALLKIAVVGAGFMGANHARIAASHPRTKLACIIDSNPESAQTLAATFGVSSGVDVPATGIDAAIVATSTSSHVEVGRRLLSLGIPVLLEKPLAMELDGVRTLLRASAESRTPLVCGFVERYNAAVRTTKLLLESEPIGVSIVRHSPFNERATASVVQDLLIHDLDLLCQLSPRFASDLENLKVAAFGRTVPASQQWESVDAIFSNSGTVANCSASRLGQRKVRTLTVNTETQLIETDLFRQTVTMYRHVSHALLNDGPGGYRAETVVDTPYVRHGGEPLFEQLSNFCSVVSGEVEEDNSSTLAAHVMADSVERCLGEPYGSIASA
jgi:predicted dehydrogenase